jgi:hypothetical protein
VAKVRIEGNAASLIGQLLQSRLRARREKERFGATWPRRDAADHLSERRPFPREEEGPGAGRLARQARFSCLPGPLGRYEPNLPAWW